MKLQKTIISGGSDGLGKMLALMLLENPNREVTVFARDIGKLDLLVEHLKEKNAEAASRLHIISADIGSPDDLDRVLDFAEKSMGNFDAIINNAGVFRFDRTLSIISEMDKEFTLEDLSMTYRDNPELSQKIEYWRLWRTNVFGNNLFVEKAVARKTNRSEHLTICNVGSVGAVSVMARKPFLGTELYNQSKEVFVSHTIALTEKNPLLTVRVVHPGPFGDSAQKIADEYGFTYASDLTHTAAFALRTFEEETDERVTHAMYASVEHMSWNTFGDIETLGIRGLSMARSKQVPKDESIFLLGKNEKVAP